MMSRSRLSGNSICARCGKNAAATAKCASKLARRPVSACGHHFHQACADKLPLTGGMGRCPLCCADFEAVKALPRISDCANDPQRWFAAADVAGEGKLSQAEVTRILTTQFSLSPERLAVRERPRALAECPFGLVLDCSMGPVPRWPRYPAV